MNKLFSNVLLGLSLLLASFFLGNKLTVSATQPEPFITICHHTPGQEGEQTVTHHFMNEQSYLGHLGTPHNEETYDTEGACEDPDEELFYGCTDDSALNFDPEANVDDGSCQYEGDACPNIEGNQENLPEGYHYETIDEVRSCVKDETPPPTSPSCSGDQHLDASGQKCVSFELGGPPAPGPATGGQVLGATTLATTGSAEENLMTMAFVLGAISLGLGTIKNASQKAYKAKRA